MNPFELSMVMSYSETNSTGATQRFLANHKTSSEQKNWTSFISGPIMVRIKFNCSDTKECERFISYGKKM